MAHPESTTGGGEAGVALNTVDDAASAFSAFFDEKPNDEQPAPAEEAEVAAPEIEAEAGEPEAAVEASEEAPEPETPAIPAPVSWSAEAKAEFAKLPPEAQKIVAQRESEREKFVQAKATEAAEAKKAVSAYEQHVAALQQQYAQGLQQYLSSDEPQKPDPAWLDTSVYGEDGPRAFYQQQQAYEAAVAQRTQAQRELEALNSQRQRQEAESRAAYDAEQHRILAENLEGWNDPATRAELQKGITATAEALGYTPERLAEVDATDVLALNKVRVAMEKAEKYDDLQKQKMEAVRAAKGLPKVAKPGTPSPKGAAEDERYQAARQAMKQGDRNAAAAVFSRFI